MEETHLERFLRKLRLGLVPAPPPPPIPPPPAPPIPPALPQQEVEDDGLDFWNDEIRSGEWPQEAMEPASQNGGVQPAKKSA